MMNSVSDSSLISANTPAVNEETGEYSINPTRVIIISFMITVIGFIVYYTFF